MAQNQLSTSDNGGFQIVEESGGHLQDEKEISQICPALLCSKVCLEYKIIISNILFKILNTLVRLAYSVWSLLGDHS